MIFCITDHPECEIHASTQPLVGKPFGLQCICNSNPQPLDMGYTWRWESDITMVKSPVFDFSPYLLFTKETTHALHKILLVEDQYLKCLRLFHKVTSN